MISNAEEWAAILDRDERLLWVGGPATGIRFSPKSIIESAFGLFFFGFAIFWTAGAATPLFMWLSGETKATGPFLFFVLFPLFGLPFIAVGAYMLFGHFFHDAYKRKRMRYALTNRRALITSWSGGKRRLQSFPITPETVVDYEPGDEATIFFANEAYEDSDGDPQTRRVGFEHVIDGAAAYATIRRIQGGDR